MRSADTSVDETIDALIARFYQLFDNRQGLSPWLHQPEQIFVADALIRRQQEGVWASFDLNEFLQPRIILLRDGRLQGFHEWEVASQTIRSSAQAVRVSHYQKSGTLDGTDYAGQGDKTFQLIQLPEGWRIAALTWIDRS